ncbi:hypothetical protein PV10_02068 [Exophiala mesophila]|uniref:Uncharacterized protein n=1 Tax=Exophiala mesophila TaxID=212818 RepID=A0A0D1Y174_EXOME|nr:uncharacterized protein PV10_02068 [Exophiala mesophila]KIV94286.1 hypothetical protein PV10_02068 [Exophiala mesophila]
MSIMPAVTRPILPPLQTPNSASFPSEVVNTPISCVSSVMRREICTPITPPSAYTDFLNALTPVLATPPATSGLQRTASNDSTSTRNSFVSTTSSSSQLSGRSDGSKPELGSVPPTPYNRRTPTALRRLRIPHSPAFSPSTCGPSPRTALSTMSTGSMMYSPFSPADWNVDSATRRYFEAPKSACIKPVSVRSVVTRTVTYKRSPPLDPAPKGKKRKLSPNPEMPPPAPVKDNNGLQIKVENLPSTLVESTADVKVDSTTLSASTSTPSPISPPVVGLTTTPPVLTI